MFGYQPRYISGGSNPTTDTLIDKLYDDQYGLTYSFDGTLRRNPNIDLNWPWNVSAQFARTTVAYDSAGVEKAIDIPVYEDFKLLGKRSIRVNAAVTNLFSAENSVSFDAAQSITLNAGTYTVSINGGTGKLVLSGGATGECLVGGFLTFTLASQMDVTFTPTDGIPLMSQLEARAYKTYWGRGGIAVAADSPRLFTPTPFTGEFGIGMLYRSRNANTEIPAGATNERYVYYIYKDSNNYSRLYLKQDFNTLQIDHRIGGVTQALIMPAVTYADGELLGIYTHIIPGEGMFIYLWQDGEVRVAHKEDTGILSLPADTNQIGIGHRLRTLSLRDYHAGGLYADVRFDLSTDGKKPNAQKYFKEVLG